MTELAVARSGEIKRTHQNEVALAPDPPKPAVWRRQPELLTIGPGGLAYNRRSIPRMVTLPDGSAACIGSMSTLSVVSSRFLNPFNRRSAHHRPIGAGAEYGYPGGVERGAWNRGSTLYVGKGVLGDFQRLRDTVGGFELGDTNQGRKGWYLTSPSDPLTTMYEVNGSGVRTGNTVQVRMPAGDEIVGGGNPFYPPYTGGDFTSSFAPLNGGAANVACCFTNFNYNGREYTDYDEWPYDDTDTQDLQGEFQSAGRFRWPAMCLMGHEINATNPAPIRHALNCTATGNTADTSIHILDRRICWPAFGTDATANPDSAQFNPLHNLGFLPYGACLCIQPGDDYAAMRAILAGSPRGLVLLDTMTYYGCYIIDRQGQTTGGKARLQMRVDNEVGRQLDGTTIAGVADEIEAALQAMIPYLSVVANPRPHHVENQLWPGDGLPYLGGGGPINENSINTAFDRSLTAMVLPATE